CEPRRFNRSPYCLSLKRRNFAIGLPKLPHIAFLSEGGVGETLSLGTKERVSPTKNHKKNQTKLHPGFG
ncbi:MAG: hypothetical protein II767_07380, partial [Proteobacteria bacterium]|nr:hypothetical protein [Pseudomonadota bacterium]